MYRLWPIESDENTFFDFCINKFLLTKQNFIFNSKSFLDFTILSYGKIISHAKFCSKN